jgi:hypothetical protein
MARTTATDSIAHMTQLDMVLDARLVLAADGATDAEWAANSMLINRYSKGAWIAEGRNPARRVTDRPIPAERTDIPADRPLPRGPGNGTSRRPTPTASGPTPRQMETVERLARKHFDPTTAETMIAAARMLTVKTISPIIGNLLEIDRNNPRGNATTAARPQRTKTYAELDAELPSVATGRYTVDGRHYKVDAPTRGRWVGRVFIRELDTDAREIGDVRDHATKLAICTAIAADPYACATAFGKATGECCRCDDHLEDPESVARGIGPYCEAKILGISITELRRLRKANPMA